MIAFALALCTLSLAQEPPSDEIERGLLVNTAEACQGYTLISPLRGKCVHLVDMEGRVVHKWPVEFRSGSEYLMEDGSLLRCAGQPDAETFSGGGQCGVLERLAWDGSVLWRWRLATPEMLQHHDIELTPDGTILLISWELKEAHEALAAGRNPARVGRTGQMWPDFVMEIDPIGTDEADILWEWHSWDHLIQDTDSELANFGDPSENPHRIDINGDEEREISAAEIAQMKALGYLVDDGEEDEEVEPDRTGDWLHTNGIDYDPERDLIALSVPRFNEIWIIDHSTSIDEAAGSEGGNFGRGGDLLWRWGNPASYRLGKTSERSLFFQHDPKFVAAGFPGAGNLTLYNNGANRPGDENYSEILELELPIVDGAFVREEGMPFGPDEPAWVYTTGDTTFFSSFISGTHRLPNGNTFITEGARGRTFEVNPEGEIVWDFRHAIQQEGEGEEVGVPPYALFRATRIPASHPGLEGKALTPIE